jgi:hypothetical protein
LNDVFVLHPGTSGLKIRLKPALEKGQKKERDKKKIEKPPETSQRGTRKKKQKKQKNTPVIVIDHKCSQDVAL